MVGVRPVTEALPVAGLLSCMDATEPPVDGCSGPMLFVDRKVLGIVSGEVLHMSLYCDGTVELSHAVYASGKEPVREFQSEQWDGERVKRIREALVRAEADQLSGLISGQHSGEWACGRTTYVTFFSPHREPQLRANHFRYDDSVTDPTALAVDGVIFGLLREDFPMFAVPGTRRDVGQGPVEDCGRVDAVPDGS
jgi:hypothetical protein